MIIFDANVLILLVSENEDSEVYERLSGVVQDAVSSKTIIGVPAPAWAEFLCGTDLATASVINSLRKRSAIRVLPFDEVAAFETSLINRAARTSGKKKGASLAPWQQVKVDRQILAIARQHSATLIYTDDDNMINEATRLGLETIRTSEIPLGSKQVRLQFGAPDDEAGILAAE